ncbi:cell division cycle protein 16 homolog [Cydia amplana]|uniref:cell division cycle protein 16 homolog n=1 Tax=Cydia amplana TaxID=1869771 RepID=UPI002FE5D130
MSKAESTSRGGTDGLNVDFMRSLVKQYSELGLWTSALFWADAAAAAGSGMGTASGDDVWLLASAMLARGEYHRAAYAVTSRGLHKQHLLCLGVAMRAHLAAQEAATALALFEESDPALLEPRTDQTHNRALAGVLVSQARALSSLERRDAASAALCSALRADCACVEALALLHRQTPLTHKQEIELLDSLPISSQLGAAEGALLRAAYRDRVYRHSTPPQDTNDPVSSSTEVVRARTAEAAASHARRLAACCDWAGALKALDGVDPWCAAPVRAACLVELKKSAELFAFAHTLVDAYPNSWTSWFAVGCYYYLIGKNELARRYLSKAKSLEPGAGCAWLAQGHSFAADNEHDQAMAAYFKASQLMAGSHLPPLYVGVECALLNNFTMCERFLLRAATLHSCTETGEEEGWDTIARIVKEPHVAHEAGAAAFAAGQPRAAKELWLAALQAAPESSNLHPRWAATLDALGHSCRKLGQLGEALAWHERALALRPARAATSAARGLCLALLGRERDAADALHAALAKDPDDVVSLALLDAIVDRLDAALTEEEIPAFPFGPVEISVPPTPVTPATPATPATLATPATPATPGGGTDHSDMSMSFELSMND